MKSNLTDEKLFQLPAGAYWVADPGSIYSPKGYSEFVDRVIGLKEEIRFPRIDSGIFIWSTAYGDGMYELKGPTNGWLLVDSGLLCIAPEELVLKEGKYSLKKLSGLGVRIVMKRSFSIKEIEEGDIEFGAYSVNTSGSDIPDDDED